MIIGKDFFDYHWKLQLIYDCQVFLIWSYTNYNSKTNVENKKLQMVVILFDLVIVPLNIICRNGKYISNYS